MKKGWPTKTLAEVCQIKPPKSEARDKVSASSLVSFLPMEDMGIDVKFVQATQTKPLSAVVGSYTYFADGDVLLAKITPCFENGKLGIADGLKNGIGFGSSEYFVFRPDPTVSKEWLYYFLSRETFRVEGAARMTGAVGHKRVSKEFIEEYPIPVPPLAEQQRIVGLLDEAFEGLATAKANAEKNLQNARALFESLLTIAMSGKLTKEWRKSHPHVETGSALLDQILAKRRRAWSKKGEYPEPTPPSTTDSQSIPASWTWTNLSQLKTFSLYGPRFSNDDYSQTGVLVLRTSDIDEHGKVNSDTAPKLTMTEEEFDKYRCKKGDLLITRTGSLGTLAVFDDDTRAIPGAYLIQFRLGFSEVIPWFLFAFFKSPAAQALLTSGGTGAGIQNLNVPTLEAIPIPFPPVDEQREIVSQLNKLAEETQRLALLYERKLAALEELKKSLLHAAFSGELTNRAIAPVVESQDQGKRQLALSTLDLHVGLIAVAYHQHDLAGKASTFGHVKCEKIIHLLEAHLEIDLERSPIKAAAGPNDFARQMQADQWASTASIFDFKKRVGGDYKPTKLTNFENTVSETVEFLGDKVEAVRELIAHFIPMSSREAELVATVYAAWNNLLSLNQPCSDADIVREAREDWHEEKLKIADPEFHSAISKVRSMGLVPTGRAKLVSRGETT